MNRLVTAIIGALVLTSCSSDAQPGIGSLSLKIESLVSRMDEPQLKETYEFSFGPRGIS